jgi:hypothetical protein
LLAERLDVGVVDVATQEDRRAGADLEQFLDRREVGEVVRLLMSRSVLLGLKKKRMSLLSSGCPRRRPSALVRSGAMATFWSLYAPDFSKRLEVRQVEEPLGGRGRRDQLAP